MIAGVVEEALRDIWRERVYPLPALAASIVLKRWGCRAIIARARRLLGKQQLGFANRPAPSWEQLLQQLADAELALLDWWQLNGTGAHAALGAAKLNKPGRIALDASLAVLGKRPPHGSTGLP